MDKSERHQITQENNNNSIQKYNNNNSIQKYNNNKSIQKTKHNQRTKHKKTSEKSIGIQQPQKQSLQLINDPIPQQVIPIQPNMLNQPYIIQQQYNQPINVKPPPTPQNVIVINQVIPPSTPIQFESIYPTTITCPYCMQTMQTIVEENFNFAKCLCFFFCICLAICLGDSSFCKECCGYCCCCCCCCCNKSKNDCKCFNDGYHYCSNCQKFLGEYPPKRCDCSIY